MILKFIAAILFVLACRGQDPPKSICGIDSQQHTSNIDLLQVSCIDYDAIRRFAPSVPWPTGTSTQVLVHVRSGDAVKVTVGDKVQWAELRRDAWGRLIALVPFDGTDFKSVEVKVYAEIK